MNGEDKQDLLVSAVFAFLILFGYCFSSLFDSKVIAFGVVI